MNNGILAQDIYSKGGFEDNLIKNCINLGGTNSPVGMPLHLPAYVYNFNIDYNKLILVFDLSQSIGKIININFQSSGRFTIDWGDGNYSIETISTPRSINYTYKSYGIYIVQIYTPSYPQIYRADSWGPKLIKILSIGNMGSSNLFNAFINATNLIEVPKNIPSSVTTLSTIFSGCSKLNDPNLSLWDTSNITSMNSLFAGCINFNQPLDNWNVRKVTTFVGMFSNATRFNSSLNNWQLGLDTTGTSCESMFAGCINFNQDLSSWDTSKVKNMWNMFTQCFNFDQNLSSWDTSNVTTMRSMFAGSSTMNFNNGNNSGINNWNVSNVTDFYQMFRNGRFNQPIGNWVINTNSSVTMMQMFSNNVAFNQDVGSWNTSKVTTISEIFGTARGFNNGGSSSINNWDTSSITDMSIAFSNCNVFNQPLNNWNVRKVTTFSNMFNNALSFNSSLSGWALGADTAATSCANMFNGATRFNQPLDSWNVNKVTTMISMFQGANAFDQNISSWNLAGLNVNTALDNFMAGKTGASALSTANYDALLIGWNNNKLVGTNGVADWRTDLRPNFGGAKYTSGGAAASARAALVTYGWTITDGGVA